MTSPPPPTNEPKEFWRIPSQGWDFGQLAIDTGGYLHVLVPGWNLYWKNGFYRVSPDGKSYDTYADLPPKDSVLSYSGVTARPTGEAIFSSYQVSGSSNILSFNEQATVTKRIRLLTARSAPVPVDGVTPPPPTPTPIRFNSIAPLVATLDAVYVADARYIRKITQDAVQSVAGQGPTVPSESIDGMGFASKIMEVMDMSMDSEGTIWFIEYDRDDLTKGYNIRSMDSGYNVTTAYNIPAALLGLRGTIYSVTWAADNNLYILVYNRIGGGAGIVGTQSIYRIPTSAPTTPEGGGVPTLFALELIWTNTPYAGGSVGFLGIAKDLVADSYGNLYVCFGQDISRNKGPLSGSIQKFSNIFVPTIEKLSSICDTFDSEDNTLSSTWTPGGIYQLSHGVLYLADSGLLSSITAGSNYFFDSIYAKIIPSEGTTATLQVNDDIGSLAYMSINTITNTIDVGAFDGAAHGGPVGTAPYSTSDKYFKIARDPGGVITFYKSPDGKSWGDPLGTSVALPIFRTVHAIIASDGSASVDNVNNTGVCGPPDEPLPPEDIGGGDEPPDPQQDPFNPNAPAPPTTKPPGQKTCSTVLEQVRLFSATVKRAVRITGANSIAMVDPNAPLPVGWAQSESDEIYWSIDREEKAGDQTLSTRKGDIALGANGSFRSNDVRILSSGWKIPDKLPVYGLEPAAVQTINYTFTKEKFVAEAVFYFRPVPLVVRGA